MTSTPQYEPDQDRVTAFWERFVAEHDLPSDARPVDVFAFGDSVEMADELLGLVVDGPKRATAGALAEYSDEEIDVPRIGEFSVICDGHGDPRAVIETTDVRIGPLSSVDEQFAWDEGEGDRTRADWLRGHTTFFRRSFARLGLDFHDDIEVVFERFRVVSPHRPDATGRGTDGA